MWLKIILGLFIIYFFYLVNENQEKVKKLECTDSFCDCKLHPTNIRCIDCKLFKNRTECCKFKENKDLAWCRTHEMIFDNDKCDKRCTVESANKCALHTYSDVGNWMYYCAKVG